MDQDAVKEILNAVRQPLVMDGFNAGARFALAPEGTTLIDLKNVLGQPDHIRQRVSLLSVSALLAYLARYATSETVVFANEQAAGYEAVLDYHPKVISPDQPDSRGECEHTARYDCPKSEEWNDWFGNSGKMLDQEAFAEFIETHLKDIVEPSGADMLQLALHLQIHKTAQFESGIRLDNGQVQFRYQETIKGTSKVGDLSIPAMFVIRIPVFVDGATFRVECRFKYQLRDGKLLMGHTLMRPKDVAQAAIKVVTAEITKGTTAPVFVGSR